MDSDGFNMELFQTMALAWAVSKLAATATATTVAKGVAKDVLYFSA